MSLKKPVELPRSGPLFITLAILAIVLTISNLAKGSRYFGYYLLAFGILIFISGVGNTQGSFVGTYNFGPGIGTFDFGAGKFK